MESPIDKLTNETLDFISECTGEVPRKILVDRMNKYFTDRQTLEFQADQVASIPKQAVGARPEGF